VTDLIVAGCRGSMCVSGEDYRRYGGNTTCFHAEVEPRHHLIVDAGTGIRSLQREVGGDGPRLFTLFLTHYHWDHIQGLPTFLPMYDPACTVDIHAMPLGEREPEDILEEVLQQPWWPISIGQAAATIRYHELDGPVDVGGVKVRHAELFHPQGVVGYRLDGEHSVVIATDHEQGDETVEVTIRQLAEGVDTLVHDAQYTPDERRVIRKGWGHSDWEGATAVARDAGAKRLVLTSHDPDRTDEQVDWIRGQARALFPKTDAAYEGMTIPL
jgi:phosphoribosyl 1,2-cyclic phosphodiesterase